MNGDHRDDYIWIGPNGEIDIYLNTNNPPVWDNHLGVTTLGVPRKTIHVADLDGDGKCDVSYALAPSMPATELTWRLQSSCRSTRPPERYECG